jgi:hypothetical protein
VIDFDAVLRDPDRPTRLLPRFASKDHLHPNDLGYHAMATQSISLFSSSVGDRHHGRGVAGKSNFPDS